MHLFPNPLGLLRVSIWKKLLALDIQGDQDNESMSTLSKAPPGQKKKDRSSPICPLMKCQNWSLKVAFSCPLSDFSSSIDCDYFTSSSTALEQLEESGWTRQGSLNDDAWYQSACHQSACHQQGRKTDKLLKYICFTFYLSVWIFPCILALLNWVGANLSQHQVRLAGAALPSTTQPRSVWSQTPKKPQPH